MLANVSGLSLKDFSTRYWAFAERLLACEINFRGRLLRFSFPFRFRLTLLEFKADILLVVQHEKRHAMHSDPQISFHAITPPFRASRGGRIHRCCTAQFIYYLASDKATTHIEIRQLFSRKAVSGAMRPRIAFRRVRILFMLDLK